LLKNHKNKEKNCEKREKNGRKNANKILCGKRQLNTGT
jgi:hypothetical protein